MITFAFVFGDLLEHVRNVDDNSVAEDSDAFRQNDSRRQEVEGEVSVADDDGVAGVVAAGAASNHVDAFAGEKVNKFAWKPLILRRV